MDLSYSDVISAVVKHTWITVNEADALRYVNKRRNQLINIINTRVDEEYFWDIFSANTVAWQNEYTFPQSSAIAAGALRIKKLDVKYKAVWEYKEVKKSMVWPSMSIEQLNTLDPSDQAFYEVRSWSVFLYPAPLESITGWLDIQVILNLPDITVLSTSADFFGVEHSELRQFIGSVLVEGVCIDFYNKAKQYTDRDEQKIEYQAQIEEMVDAISNRSNVTAVDEMPYLEDLE